MLLQIVTLDPARMARWQDDQTYGYTFAMDTLLDGRRTRSGGPDLLVAPEEAFSDAAFCCLLRLGGGQWCYPPGMGAF